MAVVMPRTERNRRRDQTMILRDLRSPRRDRRPDVDFVTSPLYNPAEKDDTESMTDAANLIAHLTAKFTAEPNTIVAQDEKRWGTMPTQQNLDDVLAIVDYGYGRTTDALYERYSKRHDALTREAFADVLAFCTRWSETTHVRHDQAGCWRREPVTGMGATVCGYSDRHAATVIAVSPTESKITVRHDKAIRVDTNGMSDSQEYRYERDPDGRVEHFYRGADGRYGNKTKGGRLVLGYRREYYDYSF